MKNLVFVVICAALVLTAGCISPELRSARIAVNERDWERAIHSLDGEIARMPASAEALYLKGYCYENLNDWANMSVWYDRSLAASNQYQRQINETRDRLLMRHLGRAAAAYDSARKLSEIQSDEAKVTEKSLYRLALANLDTGIIVAPADIRLYRQGTIIAYYYGDYDLAVSRALKALSLEKEGDRELSTREVLLAINNTRKNQEEVIRWAGELMALTDPLKDTESYLRAFDALVQAYLDSDRPDKAEEATADAMKQFPGRSDIKMNLAFLMIKRDDLKAAEEVFRQILTNDPDHFEANLNLGTILVNASKWTEAIPYLEKAYHVEADNRIAIQNLMAAYYNSGQEARGKEMKKLLDALPH